ncbi:PREDICTED: TPA-induced transmembrane protein [Chrysochloris asiatica]|uniref:TPA-induced transmembrane protein n=1 Tax=Chrysochloris asiatica TaxID=185453 RepID=A0A9B0TMD3_CHRAS|nr:PREDICTED: TPA-induced transmembrane protein [Chrysochloris asiatica]
MEKADLDSTYNSANKTGEPSDENELLESTTNCGKTFLSSVLHFSHSGFYTGYFQKCAASAYRHGLSTLPCRFMEGANSPPPDQLELMVLDQDEPDERTALSPSMEGANFPSLDQLELMVLDQDEPDERTALNGAISIATFSADNESNGLQTMKQSPWSSCNKKVVGKCKLWMVIASIFIGLILVIIISLCLIGANYIDEDENEMLELTSNKTFFIMLKIPEECITEEELPVQLTKRLTDVYSSSSSLSRYFTSVEIVDFSGGNATVTYHLQFGVPSDDDNFMKYMMSEELVLGILLQDFHDQNIAGCEALGLEPTSFSLFERNGGGQPVSENGAPLSFGDEKTSFNLTERTE